jgi:subtilisin family serine protease
MFLFLAQFTNSALVPEINNRPELKPQASNTYIVHANHLAKPPHFASLQHWYHSMVDTHSHRPINTTSRLLYTYDAVMHGFAVQLTDDEARRMSGAPGVTGVYKERLLNLQTTRSPGFIGLDPRTGAWNETSFGDGVIIGFIDSGIWPESASFNDSGLSPVRSSWKGKCVDAHDFDASLCNNKLVGAKVFNAAAKAMAGITSSCTVPSPRDKNGHGTHVASTAAGAEVPGAGLYMFSRGTARGMAPKARIAMYKACDHYSCSEADIVAAIDAAVKDGVDIISISLGGSPRSFHNDTFAIATFGAERQGIFVVLAGGNAGPEASTVINLAPWMTIVGAATVDRLFPANLTLGNGDVLEGQSLYTMKAKGTPMMQLVAASADCHNQTEWQSWTPDTVMGKIVVCMSGATVAEGILLQIAGGAGIVDVDHVEWSRDGSSANPFTLPGLTLSYTTAAEKLWAYMMSEPNPVASFSFGCETAISNSRAPVVAGFSSRGPNSIVPELLKPDLVAPGVNILAAWSGDASVSGDGVADGRTADYNIISGTSMACPHVAGVAALIKKKHPSWTPAMIRSALMTTAWTLDDRGRDILDNGATAGRDDDVRAATPLAAGAGYVHPNLALDPGLVYDAGERDYIDFLCALNYTLEQLRLFVPDFAGCTRTLAGGPAGLNYPSFVVVFDNRTAIRTLTRTLTKVSEEAETYSVTVKAPKHVKVIVTPRTLEFKEPKETKSYTVEFRNEARGRQKTEWGFGCISWENENHRVKSPVAFHWN